MASEPWAGEPSNDAWQADGGFPCRIVRHSELLHLCGYVAVPEGHPWHGKHYDALEPFPDVHGGLTYAAAHAPNEQPDSLWWLGFDCAHAGDLIPGIGSHEGDVYRDMAFVRAECEWLAQQAHSSLSSENELPEGAN